MTSPGPAPDHQRDDLRCPRCFAQELQFAETPASAGDIEDDAIRCGGCGRAYSIIWGVPFLGALHKQDVLSLIEMVSHAQEYLSPEKEHGSFQPVIDALEEYARASDKEGVLRRRGFSPKPSWWEHRYHEQVEFNLVAAGIDFRGARVLDVGAGMGSDALRYAARGAHVTALEFSFSLFGPGARLYPEFRWIGGGAHALPFEDESFDVVVAHNSLHHHTDQGRSMSEMLRVLRPGGHLLTTGDPFRSDDQTELDECRVFDHHAGVLTGTNEQIPPYSSYVGVLEQYADSLDVHAFVVDSATESCQHLRGARAMPSQNVIRNEGLSLRVKKTRSVPIAGHRLGESVVAPADYARRLKEGPARALECIVGAVDERQVDLPLLGEEFPKFRLLNGWKLVRAGDTSRTAYKRGRLFFRNTGTADPVVHVTLLVPCAGSLTRATVRLKVNGEVVLSRTLARGVWQTLRAQLPKREASSTFALEIDVDHERATEALVMDETLPFRVERIDFGDETARATSPCAPRIEECSLAGLAASGALGDSPVILCTANYYFALDVINTVAPHVREVRVIVPDDQDGYYEWLAGVAVTDRYAPAPGAANRSFTVDLVAVGSMDAARGVEPLLATRPPGDDGPWLATAPHVSRYVHSIRPVPGASAMRPEFRHRIRGVVRRIPFAVALWRGARRLSGMVWR